jgi:hypothetical protein
MYVDTQTSTPKKQHTFFCGQFSKKWHQNNVENSGHHANAFLRFVEELYLSIPILLCPDQPEICR